MSCLKYQRIIYVSHFVQLWHQQMKQMHEILFSIRDMKKGQKKKKKEKQSNLFQLQVHSKKKERKKGK